MTLTKSGSIAAFGCAATYLFGFAFLVTVLAPLGFGSGNIDIPAVVAYAVADPTLLILWNTVIYILNALALVVLVVALRHRLAELTPGLTAVAQAIGIMWAALVLGAGMIANVGVERAAQIGATDPEAAAHLWTVLHAVELGLGGGNEIAGAVWIGLVSLAALHGRRFWLVTVVIGLISSLGGLATLIPAIGDVAGAVFGLAAIVWFIAVGFELLRQPKLQS